MFLQSSHSVVEELLFLVFQPAICRADNVLAVRNFVSFHEFFQFRKQIEVTWSQDNVPDHTSVQALAPVQNASFELLHHPQYSPFVYVLHGKWLAGRPRTAILLQRYQSFEEMLDQVHFSWRILGKKVTKYDLRISYLTVSVYELFECPSYMSRQKTVTFKKQCKEYTLHHTNVNTYTLTQCK